MVRCSRCLALAVILFRHNRGASAPYDGCTNGTVADIGDGRCNAENNNSFCGFDGGDCCPCTCSDGPVHSCSDSDLDCIYPGCGDISSAIYDTSKCFEDWHGDGMCDEGENTAECGYDGGDCCVCSCSDGPDFTCGEVGYDCHDPTCVDPSLVAEFPDCTGDWLSIGDGWCHDDLNNSLCGYDRGDCCICTCIGSACTSNTEFDCMDSAAGEELYDCAAPPPAALPCSEEIQQTWVVDDPAHVQLLAAAINCSGGSFEVEWRGNVVVNQTIYVVDGTVLTVIGAGSGAIIDGNASTRLFTIVNASLRLSNLNVSSGASIAGGAVAAAASALTFNRTNFVGNRAGSHGGAVYVSDGSTVSCVGGGTFANNEADFDGGAMFVTGESVVSCGGYWINNRAARDGGALMVGDFSNASWSEEAAFFNNTAGSSGGGVVVHGGSHLSWNATTELSFNSASLSGGAVDVRSNSSASWSGITTFVNNLAPLGGALAARDGSSCAEWSLSTTFQENEADHGGAVFVLGSLSTWSGHDTGFHENRAHYSGGGMAIVESFVSCKNSKFSGNSAAGAEGVSSGGGMDIMNSNMSCENTTFANNSAVGTGGALHIHEYSSVLFGGGTDFHGNRAVSAPDEDESGYGGCLSMDWSRVTWSGEVQFVNNSAETVGGALYVGESIVSWSEGKTKFDDNSALSGGAIFVWNESAITWTGDTEFTSNTAVGDGGAVASPAIDSTYNLLDSTLVINGSTLFANNTCGANGGGLAMVEGLSLEFGMTADVDFVANNASVAGGAVFISGTGVGPKFIDVNFISNSAEVGGAVASLGSGNVKGFADDESLYPTTFERCHFVGNRAVTTGGAVDSAAGQDEVIGCLFQGNKAVAGGALRLAGAAAVKNCSFVDNVSSAGGGSAVSNIGSISSMANIFFSDNVFHCEPGEYSHYDEGVPYDVICSGCATECQDCSFDELALVPACKAVMEHSSSNNSGATLATVSINSGFWRATPSSPKVLACYNEDACLGGVTGSAGYCREGYTGAYCAVCTDGYTQQQGFSCSKCSNGTSGIVIMTVFGVVALCVGAAVVSYVVSGEEQGTRRGPVARLLRNIPLQSVKIVIAAWQILTQFAALANVTYPDVYQRFLDGLDVVNFDLGWIFSAGCVLDLDFHHRLMIMTIGPIVALFFLGGTYLVATTANRGAPDALQIIWNKHMSMVLLLTFFVYSSVSAILFSTFACETLDDHVNYLRVDYRIKCDSSRHRAFQVYAGFMIVLYTVGIPFFYGTLLFRDREILKQDAAQRIDIPRVTAISDLWKPYRPSAFYYEVVDCGRRLLLAGVVVFISPGTAGQLAITLLMAFVFVVLSEVLSPYASRWDTWLSRIGHAVVFMSVYFALLLKVDVSNEGASSQKVFERVLVGAHACMVLVIVLETVVLTCYFRAEQQPLPSLQPLRRLHRSKETGGKEGDHCSGPCFEAGVIRVD